MHFMQWMECAMYYEISVFDSTCFQSTIIWMLQMYAVGWNMPCSVLLNSHTCFNLPYGSQEHIVSQDIEYPYMYSTLASYWTMMPNEYGHLHTGQKTNEWSIHYHYLQITIKNLPQTSCETTNSYYLCHYSWCLGKWSKILIDI